MTTPSPLRMRRPRPATVLRPVLGTALVLAVAACGGGGGGGAAAATPRSTTGTSGGAGNRPGVSGTIAAVSSTNAQVQNQTEGQVTVSWTPTTTFAKTTTASASAVKVGDCVSALSTQASSGSTASAFTATTVTVTQPVNGKCTGGFGAGGFGGGFRGGNRTPPAGATPRPNRTRPAGAGRFDSVFGTVTAVSGSTITVKGVRRGARSANATASPAPTATVKVTIGSSTTVEQTSSATSSALAVGECLTAFGKADDTGAVTATSISVRPAGKTGCSTGFRGGGFGSGGSGSGAPGQAPGGTTNG